MLCQVHNSLYFFVWLINLQPTSKLLSTFSPFRVLRCSRMTPRQLRRAAERKQRKQELKAARSVSDAQVAANQANSQLSTGPTSPEGKAKSSLNAVKTGLTGRTVVLPTDDAAVYENHIREYFHELKPVGVRESELAQSLADTAWRLERIRSIEMAIYAQGHIQFADLFDAEHPAIRRRLVDLHTHLTYEKQLRNLQLQEARLRRHREKDSAELRQLQQERLQKENEQLETTARPSSSAQQNGFEFSTPQTRPADAVATYSSTAATEPHALRRRGMK